MLVATLTFAGCCGCGNYKYEVSQGEMTYFTNEINHLDGGCITFTASNNSSKDPLTICGSYTIKENKDYKPENPKFRR